MTRYLVAIVTIIAFVGGTAALIGLIVWLASTGALECDEGKHSEVVSYITTTQMVGKTPVSQTTPVYSCVKD